MTDTNRICQKSPRRSPSIILALACGSIFALSSCAGAPNSNDKTAASSTAPASLDAAKTSASTAPAEKAGASKNEDAKKADGVTKEPKAVVPKPQKPQLIKTAHVSLKLDSIEQSITKLRELSQSKGGDIYSLQDDQSPDRGDHRKASLVIKVPVESLDITLAGISKLGKVQSQKLESNDVTQQIVDSDARLKNLRQQEDQTRKIMDRAGSINDTLNVSRSLAEIREQIEQIDAQVKNMRQQVAYSTIHLELEELQAKNPSGDPIGFRIQETWKSSTGTAGGLFTNIGLTLLWLLPFSPLFAAGAGIYWLRRKKKVALASKVMEAEELAPLE
jgi:archaellum component FlaC